METAYEWLERDRSTLVAIFGSEGASEFESAAKQVPFYDECGGSQRKEFNIDEMLNPNQYLKQQIHVPHRPPPPCVCHLVDLVDYDSIVEQRILRRKRQHDAKLVPRVPRRTPGVINQRYTCTWFGGGHDVSDTEATCGFNWAAVHGMNSICVAMRKEDLQWETIKRRETSGEFPETSLRIFKNGLISKVEGFVDPSTLQPHPLHQIITKPFGIVSVVAAAEIDRNCEQSAISYLQDQFHSHQVFTYDFTVKTAICALGHLFNCEFKANELQVFVWKRKGGRGQAKALTDLELEATLGDFVGGREFDEAQEQEIREINEELAAAAMNKPDKCDIMKDIGEEIAASKKRPMCERHAMRC